MAEAKKLTDLQRVQAKAIYNYQKRLRLQEEEEAFKNALDAGNPLPGQGGNYETEADKKESKK